MRVLVVEDEAQLAQDIAAGLRDGGLAVDLAQDGAEALEKAAVNRYDVVLLDRDLPVVHGDDVCRELVASCNSGRILMLTASGDLQDRVGGLNLGADDYLAKPFAFAELLARVHSLGRRRAGPARPTLTRNGLVLDRGQRRAARDGRPVELTRKEFGVLEALMDADGEVLSAEDLLERVWDEHADPFTNAVRITMTRLRHKLGEPPLIETVVGVGYRMLA